MYSGHFKLLRILYLMQSYLQGQIADKEILDTIWKNFSNGRLTFLHWNKGEEMDPVIGTQGGTLLVRKLPAPNPVYGFPQEKYI